VKVLISNGVAWLSSTRVVICFSYNFLKIMSNEHR